MAIQVVETFQSAEHHEEQEKIACPLCGGVDEELVLQGRDLLFAKPGPYRLVRCRGCELEFVNPRPTPEALGPHYPANYFGYALHDEAPSIVAPFLKAFAMGISLKRIGFLEKVVGRLTDKLLMVDVGCGTNRLLTHIKELRGLTGLGVDFKPEIVAYVRDTLKMPIVQGTLEGAHLDAGRFDVVSMMEYLEHEPDPKRVLQEARRITKPGGYLALELPHIAAAPGRLFRSVWWNLDLPRHLIFFTPKTLGRMLDDVGFELVKVNTFSFPLYVGMSIAQALGLRHWERYQRVFPAISTLLGLPFWPLMFLLPEFMFAIARAKE